MQFVGTGKRLDDIDLPRIGSRIGVGEDEIHAVLDVECAGRGFDSQNRLKTLFEPHIFYRELGDTPARDQAVRMGLAYKSWRPGNYPRDSYPRLIKAMGINREAALRSASWGLPQMMGFNHQLAGYESAESMITDFLKDEDRQLNAMVTFIINAGLDDELRNHDWAGFAKGYNGKYYYKHGYHTRLKAAYDKWAKIPDTEWKREVAVKTAHTVPAETDPWWMALLDAFAALLATKKGG